MLRILLAVSRVDLQEAVEKAVDADKQIEIVGVARNGVDAVRLAKELRPDLTVLGIHLRKLDGVDTTREIMIEAPMPIVLVAHAPDPDAAALSVRALAAGALAVIPAPLQQGGTMDEASARKFLSTLKAMAQVKVVRRWRGKASRDSAGDRSTSLSPTRPRIAAVAASTGGPAAIQAILSSLPHDFPIPVLVVLHLSTGFAASVARWLDEETPLRVKLAQDGERLQPGMVYLAPDDHHLGVAGQSRVRVADDPAFEGFRPSATYLFDSVARAFGPTALAVILTGMGNDGIEGLRSLYKSGGNVIAQDEASSVVFGMPKAAMDAGIVHRSLPLDHIARSMTSLARSGQWDG